jgi:hypothetical protein
MLLQLASVKFEAAVVTGTKYKPSTTKVTPQSILV